MLVLRGLEGIFFNNCLSRNMSEVFSKDFSNADDPGMTKFGSREGPVKTGPE